MKVLQQVWTEIGMPSGKYLAAVMADTMDQLDLLAELDGPRYTPFVPTQLVAVRPGYSCAILSGGIAKCWGSKNHRQLGDGSKTSSSNPVVVTGITDATATTAGY